jgi:large subunit ribosomal protein L24
MSKWIKKGDKVVVICGNDRGKTGTVLARLEQRIVVQGINIRKKHVKKTQKMQSAQILDREMPIHISNVSLCDEENKPIRLKVREKKEKKELVYNSQGKEVIFRSIKK